MPRKHLTLPSKIVLFLTENCNLRCKMCFYWGEYGAYKNNRQGKRHENLDIEIAKKLIVDLKDVRPKPYYSLYGGEPLTYPHFEELINFIKDNGSTAELQTNGILLKDYSEMIVDSSILGLKVSIDGPEEINNIQRGKGAYRKAFEGIKQVQKEKLKKNSKTPRINLLFTITPINWKYVKDFFVNNDDIDYSVVGQIEIQMENFLPMEDEKSYQKFLKSYYGITNYEYSEAFVRPKNHFKNINPAELTQQVNDVISYVKEFKTSYFIHPPTYSIKNITALLDGKWTEMEDLYKTCSFPWAGLDILASGDVAPCHTLYDLTVGNLHENNISEIWYGEKYQILRNYLKEKGFMPCCHGCCVKYLFGEKEQNKS